MAEGEETGTPFSEVSLTEGVSFHDKTASIASFLMTVSELGLKVTATYRSHGDGTSV